MIEKMRDLVAKRTGAEVTTLSVVKNNGVKLTGISIKENGKRIAPVIYVDELLIQIKEGNLNMQDAVSKIVNVYEECRDIDLKINEMFMLSRENILENVEYRLINRKMNRKMLKDMPHRDFLDLAATYVVTVSSDTDYQETFLIKNEMLDAWKISLEELDNSAKENTCRTGFKTRSMVEILSEITGCDMRISENNPQMYVLSNVNAVNGANVMLFNQPFEKLAEKCSSDLYILPSSIHEVIAIPITPDMRAGELKMLVSMVNDSEVSEQERLSGNVYRYSKENNEMSIAV